MPGRHPDDDELADLAADVLPLAQARAVEAHVLDCERCAALLSDAEHVRNLLLADDAGPVPAEIWNRIEAALQAASAPSRPTDAGRQPAPPPPAPPAGRRVGAAGQGGWDGPDPLDDPEDWATAIRPRVESRQTPRPGPATGSLRRLSTSRRDARPERRRPATLLLGAAAAVVLVLAVATVRLVQSGGGGATAAFDSRSSGAAAASAPAAVVGALIVRSNADYTSATLKERARALVGRASSRAATAGSAAGGSAASPVPRAVPGSTAPPSVEGARTQTPQPLSAVEPDPQATDVTNPARLRACLTALGAPSDPVVAVDLARYQGREAAVIVLRSQSGYEVWVVERTCDLGNEGALAETTLPG